MLIYQNREILDADTWKRVNIDVAWGSNELFTTPPVWGLLANNTGTYISREGVSFIRHIKDISWVDVPVKGTSARAYVYSGGVYYINGVIKKVGGIYCSLYVALKDENFVGYDVYIPNRTGGYVKLEFDDGIGLFITKIRVLK